MFMPSKMERIFRYSSPVKPVKPVVEGSMQQELLLLCRALFLAGVLPCLRAPLFWAEILQEP